MRVDSGAALATSKLRTRGLKKLVVDLSLDKMILAEASKVRFKSSAATPARLWVCHVLGIPSACLFSDWAASFDAT